MLHNTLNPKDWQKHFQTFDSIYIEGLSGRFLINKSRINSVKGLNDVLRAIQKIQNKHKNWKEKVWQPIYDAITKHEKDGQIIFHAKHESGKFWEYEMRREEYFNNQFSWTFRWKDSVKYPNLLDLGQQFYSANEFEEKFTTKLHILRDVLRRLLHDFIYKKYNREWLEKNQFSEKLVKITLRGEQFWFKIGRGRSGHPKWELFIFQSANLEEIRF
jgi:hypothetical protein